jgi:acyl carrier protein
VSAPDPKFIEVLSKHLKYLKSPGELSLDGPLRNFGLSSKDAVDLMLDIEDAYGFAFPDEFLNDRTFATADSLWQAVMTIKSSAGAR